MNGTPQPPMPGGRAGREEVEADIEVSRDRLAADIAALAAKADVSAQLKAKIEETRGNVGGAFRQAQRHAMEKVRSLPRTAQLAIPAAIGGLGAVLVVVGRKRRFR